MKLKEEINGLFNRNTNYTYPSQSINQASSLISLSTDLYTDSKRFVYELLQNADDSSEPNKTVKVWIKTFDDYLIVAHTGKAFDARDLRGLCNVNDGTKKEDSNKTGYKGIGFKSVFGQSDKVIVFTNNEYFRFDSSYPFEWKWEDNKDIWEEKEGREFSYPWQIIPIYTEKQDVSESVHSYLQRVNVATIIKLNNKEETIQAIQELSENVNMFLFLKNISEINFDINAISCIEINRSEPDKIILKKNGIDEAQWLINTINLNVPKELKLTLQDERNFPKKLLTANTIELTLAAKMDADGIADLASDERLLYSYLPTDETKYSLPVLVNTSFLTNANREHLHDDSKWNHWIFKNIAIEIFKWISQLVKSEIQFQAYNLIPNKVLENELGKYFNESIKEAIDTVAFVVSKKDKLVKIEDALIDFTFLSEKEFIGEALIKKFIDDFNNDGSSSSKVFIKYSKFWSRLKGLGVTGFEWNDFTKFLQSRSFLDVHSIENNIELIKHLKYLSEKESVAYVSTGMLSELPFIWDHKDILNIPSQVYFPTADDVNWNASDSELSFLHKELQDWLSSDSGMRAWIEDLGVIEKTDISFIRKTIIPNVESYITQENAIQTILNLFNLYKKGDLRDDLLSQLSKLKLLTQKDTLLTAKDCYLSNIYSPRLEIEDVLDADIFISEKYFSTIEDKDEWKRFFKFLGVGEGISCSKNKEEIDKEELIKSGFLKPYFEEEDKKFSPYVSTFTSDYFSEVATLNHIQSTVEEHSFSKVFWADVIENVSCSKISELATAFWGRTGFAGRNSGNKVGNYIPWFIKNVKCIPVITKECQITASVFLNADEIKSLAGSYLPVFDGVDLSPDWKSFFGFKTCLKLSDYLKILSEISSDMTEKGKVKNENVTRIQGIYKELLDQCGNWNGLEIQQVSSWGGSGKLLNTKYKFMECSSLKYFLDGNNSIFQDQVDFLEINAENKRHKNIGILLEAFNVTALKQSDFELIYDKKEPGTSLVSRLKDIIPYFKAWVSVESNNEETQRKLSELDNKVASLSIYEAETLQIEYGDIEFTKSVNVHLNSHDLFVTKPWKSNKVLLQLPTSLCRYFYLIGHDNELDFLLRSTNAEIKEYFDEEGIVVPEGVALIENQVEDAYESVQDPLKGRDVKSFDEIVEAVSNGSISPEFYFNSKSDYERFKFVQGLISRAVSNITKYLSGLSEYDCANYYEIAPSIIGGITKNGSDITIVARPSDNDMVLLYYTAEFDVLEYVDAELWCEGGSNVPYKITLGKLLKMTEINRIPITNFTFTGLEFEELLIKPKSVNYEFNAVPFSPYKTAEIISSFANTEGGSLIFGINELSPELNTITGLSSDFRVDEIIKKSITFLSSKPIVSYDWVNVGDEFIFVIKVNKSEVEITLGNKRYIRSGSSTILEEKSSSDKNKEIKVSEYARTIAIVIGIEKYKPRDENKIDDVKYAENDVRLFENILITKMNVKEENIHIFLGEKASKNDLQYDLKGLFHELTAEDRLIFYYVGHGFHNGVDNYLSTYDMHPFYVAETAVSLRTILLDPLSQSKCKTAIIFIDACAQSIQDENSRNTLSNIDADEIRILSSELNYLASYFSCQLEQSSYSCDKLEQGIWTYHLVRAINGEVNEVIDNNKYITDRSLGDYLGKNVAEYANKQLGYSQNPRSIFESNSEYLVVELSAQSST